MIIFTHTEKTGGETIHSVLQHWHGTHYRIIPTIRHIDHHFSSGDLSQVLKGYKNLPAIGGHCPRPDGNIEAVVRGARYITFFREPVERCISEYQHQVDRWGISDSFADWMTNERNRNCQTRKRAGTEDLDAAVDLLEDRFAFVGLAKRVYESMSMLTTVTGNKIYELAVENKNVPENNEIKHRIMSDPRAMDFALKFNELDIRCIST